MRELRDLKTKMQGVMEEKENLNSDNQETTKRRDKLQLMIKDIQDELEGDKSARVHISKKLKKSISCKLYILHDKNVYIEYYM